MGSAIIHKDKFSSNNFLLFGKYFRRGKVGLPLCLGVLKRNDPPKLNRWGLTLHLW